MSDRFFWRPLEGGPWTELGHADATQDGISTYPPDGEGARVVPQDALRRGLAGGRIVVTMRLPARSLATWQWYRALAGRRHPGESAARRQYARRVRARRRR